MFQCIRCAFTASVSVCVEFSSVFAASTVMGMDKGCSIHSQRARITMNESRLCFGPHILLNTTFCVFRCLGRAEILGNVACHSPSPMPELATKCGSTVPESRSRHL
jgi:hypothetical protein